MQEHKARAKCRRKGEESLEGTYCLMCFSWIRNINILHKPMYGKDHGYIV